ncbi:amidohydrolase family protein [Pedobacter aquatilis]|uniref:amidohydrolase family protein n=1 Tax=Pedobacter aquatilis TaxID=351343 RepID=UPI0025B2BCFE|nr:amidohydrolase family protein [Pedobacter aquatilis]MDN3585626.1 amidohydrolase family protein [Pedobacter aquatilis]
MLKYFSADWIFPVNIPPIKNGTVAVNEIGEIVNLFTEDQSKRLEVKKYTGAIVPGFVNTHCHLELSHMFKQIPAQTGLVEFVKLIIKSRHSSEEQLKSAMEIADKQMFDNGIVAVGDISNQISSKQIKLNSKIAYHTFIEAMGFYPDRAEAIMAHAKQVEQEFSPLPTSIVPHAPYSVSSQLFQLINKAAIQKQSFLSIHNQETPDENLFFQDKTGGFLELYRFLGLDIEFFRASGNTSLKSYLPYISNQKTLLVHNTVSSKEDIAFAKQINSNLYWCLCPNANLYIENTLPDVDLLIQENVKITLGTDSLASNHQLNILAEMKTLQENKNVSFDKLLSWATINGAEFLAYEKELGTIEIGKKPSLNLIQLTDDFKIITDKVTKLA